MNWIISNPYEVLVLAWSIGLKHCVLACSVIATVAFFISRFKNTDKGRVKRSTIFVMVVSSVLIFGCGAYRNLTPRLNSNPNHEYYGSQFNDIQSIQIVAAKRYGIDPLKDRSEAESLIKEGQLKRVRSCKNYQLAPMGHSMPYLTNYAAELLNDIGKNFRDSLDAKGMGKHKVMVTSILRSDADVAKLMKHNKVAVKNSAHRHATTFDVSYTLFISDGLITRTTSRELKRVLAEVLSDLRMDKRCYVKYEKSQNCFHITVRS